MYLGIQEEIAKSVLGVAADMVYIGAFLLERDGIRYPVYPTGVAGGFEYAGIDDTKGRSAYVRPVGGSDYGVEAGGGCNDIYLVRQRFRIVVQQMGSGLSSSDVAAAVVTAVGANRRIRVVSLEHDKRELFDNEQRGAKTAFLERCDVYFALDVEYCFHVTLKECGVAIRCEVDNYKIC